MSGNDSIYQPHSSTSPSIADVDNLDFEKEVSKASHDQIGSIGRRTAGGALWVFLAVAVGRIIAFGSNVVLVRLLSPDDFGLVSFSMILIGAFTVLQDLGVPSAIVYDNRDVRKTGGTALTINVVTSLVLLTLVVLTSPWLARLGNDGDLRPIASVLAVGLVFSSLGSVQNAVLMKEMAFRRRFLPEVVSYTASGAFSIVLALLSFGVWSLVIGYLARSLVMTVMLWSLSTIRPYPRFEWGDAKDLLRYGRHVSLSAILGFIGANVDYLVVGSRLGTHHLGIYTVAFVTASLPSVVLRQVMSQTTFPAYSSVRRDSAELIRLFQRVFRVVASAAILIGILMVFGAPAYVSVVLGDRWSDVVAPLQILGVYAMFRSVGLIFPPVYKAIGRPDIEWHTSLIRLAIVIPALYWSAGHGIVMVALTQAAVAALFMSLNTVIITRLLELSIGGLARLIAPQLLVLGGLTALAVTAHNISDARHYSLQATGSLAAAVVALGVFATVMLVTSRHHITWGYQSLLRHLGR